jgi:hypothetical protein
MARPRSLDQARKNFQIDPDLMATAEGRQQMVRELTVAVCAGEISVYQAQAAQKLLREYRDNLTLLEMEREVRALSKLMREVIARKSGLSVDEVKGIVDYLTDQLRAQKIGDQGDGDESTDDDEVD